MLDKVSAKVAQDSSSRSLEWLQTFSDSVISLVPDNYSDIDGLKNGFDSVLNAYNLGMINWMRMEQAVKYYRDGMKDGSLSEKEVDRISGEIDYVTDAVKHGDIKI